MSNSKAECWLRPNRRPLAAGAIVAGVLAFAGALLCTTAARNGWSMWLIVGSGAAAAFFFAEAALLLKRAATPRLGYDDGFVLAYVCGSRPVRIPVNVIECFFLGQAPDLAPAISEDSRAVVVRLAESAADWRQHDAWPRLARWCDGYISIRGAWCEPITGELVKKMNRRLFDAHRATQRENDLNCDKTNSDKTIS